MPKDVRLALCREALRDLQQHLGISADTAVAGEVGGFGNLKVLTSCVPSRQVKMMTWRRVFLPFFLKKGHARLRTRVLALSVPFVLARGPEHLYLLLELALGGELYATSLGAKL